MHGADHQQADMFSYLSPEQRVRKDHPLRAVRATTDEVLGNMSALFDAMYAEGSRPSIPPEKLLRAQLLKMLYSVRSERLLMEEIDYSILFRWFVGLNLDETVWERDELYEEPRPFAGNPGRIAGGRVIGVPVPLWVWHAHK
jgi:transposase